MLNSVINKKIISAIAYIEMIISVVTVIGLSAAIAMGEQHKPCNVFVFVLVTAWVSFGIGLGILLYKEWARLVLVFFSGCIIVIKILIFAGLVRFNGEIITAVPADVKNLISIGYHLFIVVYFTRLSVKKEFIFKG